MAPRERLQNSREDNLFILREYTDIDDVEAVYDAVFRSRKPDKKSYMELGANEKLARAMHVLVDTFGEETCYAYLAIIIERQLGTAEN